MPGEDQERDAVDQWFAVNLKTAREAAGLSQDALAAMMREAGFGAWKQQTVAKQENAARRVTLAEARALARILHVPDAQLTWPPETVRDVYALQDAAGMVAQRRDQAAYYTMMRAEAREELRTIIASLREAGKGEALAEQIADAERALKEDEVT